MNIFKAVFFTALLLGLDIIISLGIYEFIELKLPNSLSDESLIHYFGITNLMPRVIAYFIVFYFSFRSIFNFNKGIEKVKAIKPKFFIYLILITIGLEFLNRPLFDFSEIYNYLSGVELKPFEFPTSSNLPMFYRGISVLIFAPMLEELFFRKFLFGEVLKKDSLTISIIISSICFSLIHLPSYRNLLPTFIFGIIACLIYNKTKNIFYTILLHFLTNLSWLLLALHGRVYYEWSYGLKYNFIYWLLFLLGIGFSFVGIKKVHSN